MSGAPPDTPEEERDPLLGRVIAGKFAIERHLGAGAMGAVYRAHQTALERPVAIKVMHRAFAADPTYAARFHLEAKAASRLDHPNLIRVLDYGQEADGLLYIAMEYLDCRDLFTILVEDWPLSHERIVELLSQTLSGLADAHEAGVLHRDLKPENIMVVRRKGEDGAPIDVVKVCDFGIAKLVEPAGDSRANGAAEGRKLTTAGLIMGTPEYMSPEQARGETSDARSDVYAMGVILYQLLTRRLPFKGKSSIEVVWKAMNDEPDRLDSDGSTAAPGLDPICLKAMSKRPEDRFQSAREMLAALRSAPSSGELVVGDDKRLSFAQAPTLAHAVPPSKRTDRFSRGLLASASLLLVALVATGVLATRRALPRSASTLPPSSPLSVGTPDPPAVGASSVPAREQAVAVGSPVSSAIEPAPGAAILAAAPAESHRVPRGRSTAVAIADVRPQDSPTPPPPPPVESSAPIPAPSPPTPSPPTPSPPSPPASSSASTVTAAPPTPPPAPPPSFNLETARVELGQVKSNNAAATGSSVSRALGPLATKFTACYRGALAQNAGATEGVATLHLETDDGGYVTVARVTGASPPSAARCIEAASRNLHIEVDTGTANADVTLTLKPL